VLPPHYFKGYTSDRPDSTEEWWIVWEGVPVMDSEWSWSMGYLYEPWNWNCVESDGFGEEIQCRREQAAALSLAYFAGGEFPMLRGWKRSRTAMEG
jgi:hypothetical protein